MYQILLVKFSHVLKYEVVNDKHSYEPRAIGQRVCIEEDEFWLCQMQCYQLKGSTLLKCEIW